MEKLSSVTTWIKGSRMTLWTIISVKPCIMWSILKARLLHMHIHVATLHNKVCKSSELGMISIHHLLYSTVLSQPVADLAKRGWLQIMIFIIDLTIKAEEKVLRLWSFSYQKPPKPHFRGAKIQNFPEGEPLDPLYASTFSSARASIQTQIRHWSTAIHKYIICSDGVE